MHNQQPERSATALTLQTQIFRFIVSGCVSALPDLGLTWLLNIVFGVNVPISRTVGFIVGTTTAYLINRRWTFRAEPSWRRFFAVAVLYTITYGINLGGQTLGQHVFAGWGWNASVGLVVAFVLSQGTATVVNFIIQRTLIFRVR
ncbi:GtrA family protein [Corynebacterium uberis]|uniref:GtrA family protein n=1 Tax=Corynebacterium TaxID=1716 RepID=UPI001D09BF78|nr:GtrA family protein [Corynebacterium uberis]MCZ9309878.1 GtrA family protein [Corynebacterium sp. c6VSa_13]UDL73198.1 GtrA family protein [Corynebacterium uberis]UDL75925.1 GtrA family protein [Corynebacterium uberis]UDL78137.1 GtrA family protein [Corynebacterium uberis]UDL80420.1 GtrA family protein [Corynebacterium uberis]